MRTGTCDTNVYPVTLPAYLAHCAVILAHVPVQGVLPSTDFVQDSDNRDNVAAKATRAFDASDDAPEIGASASASDVDTETSDSDSGDDGGSSPPTPQLAAGARRYPRRVPAPAAQRKADASAQFLASMRAHFEQVEAACRHKHQSTLHLPVTPMAMAPCTLVPSGWRLAFETVCSIDGDVMAQVDAFELAVETPSPVAPRRRQQSPPTAEATPAAAREPSTGPSGAALGCMAAKPRVCA